MGNRGCRRAQLAAQLPRGLLAAVLVGWVRGGKATLLGGLVGGDVDRLAGVAPVDGAGVVARDREAVLDQPETGVEIAEVEVAQKSSGAGGVLLGSVRRTRLPSTNRTKLASATSEAHSPRSGVSTQVSRLHGGERCVLCSTRRPGRARWHWHGHRPRCLDTALRQSCERGRGACAVVHGVSSWSSPVSRSTTHRRGTSPGPSPVSSSSSTSSASLVGSSVKTSAWW